VIAQSYDIEQRTRRWCEFLDMARPAQHMFLINHDPDAPERPKPWPQHKAERIDWAAATYERMCERVGWLVDDRIPYLDPYTGTEIFAEAFGCEVYRPADDMPSARPLIDDVSQVAALKVPDVGATPLAMLFEIADALRRRAGSDALMKLPDIQSPMDIAALVLDKSALFVALLDAPEAVAELAGKIHQLMVAFLDEWFARYGTSFIAHYPYYYMPRGITLSEDEVGSVNAEMFVEHFLPELAGLSDRYGGIGIHCCADSRHQWEGFRKVPSLRLLNLVQPPEVLREAYAFFAGDTTQMHGTCWDGAPETWPDQAPAASRCVFETAAETHDDALGLAEKLWIACGRG